MSKTLAKTRLDDLEAVVEHGLTTFVEVGNALREIRNDGLYKQAGFNKFDDYCKERWGWQRAHAYRLMDAASVAKLVSPMGDIPNERQARELLPLKDDPAALTAAWQEANEATNGKPTAEAVRDAVRPAMKVHYSSEEEDWHTPSKVLSAVYALMGSVTLDPCSNVGEPNVKAERYFTPEQDGLALPWSGNVYMNPPYGKGIGDWIEKLAASHESGMVPEAIALVPARTETAWMQRVRDYPRCFIRGRLKFSSSDQGAPFPSVAVYFGADPTAFTRCFSKLGDTYVRFVE